MITDPVFQVDADGIKAPTYEQVLDYFKNEARAIFGTDINLDSDTQDGRLLAIFAMAVHDTNSQAIAVYNSFNPQTASGVGLDSAVKTNGIKRRDATQSQVDLTVVGQAGTVIENGAALDQSDQKWLLPERVVIPLSGEITVSARAEDDGALNAAVGAISRIGTPTRGWQSVTNKAEAVPGVAIETDSELRARQAKSTSLPSVSLWEGVIGSLMALDGVIRVSGVKNDGDTPSNDGVPGHSIAMIVDGGDTASIGETIFKKKGEGVGTHGSTSTTYVDSYGFPNVVKFSRPKVVRITVKVGITAGATYLSSVADEIKTRIVEYVNSLPIGESVGIARVLACAIKDCAVGVDTRFTIDSIVLGKDSAGQSASSISIAWNEAAHCSPEDVQVEVA